MISQDEFKKRRERLIDLLPNHAIAVIPGALESIRNGDVHYPFRQNSDFLYLTGFNEAEAVLVLVGGKHKKTILFCQPFDTNKEIWTGPLFGPEKAKEYLGIDEAYSIHALSSVLPELFKESSAIYYPFLQSGNWEKTLFQAWKLAHSHGKQDKCFQSAFCDISPLIAEMRLFKSKAEIGCMQKAIDVSAEAHSAVMRKAKHCETEYQLLAIFQHELLSRGFVDTAYPSIIASGPNACILHYTQYHRAFDKNDLLLIDAGAEYCGYAADITRTFPISGHWQIEQKLIYELVLEAQLQAIAMIKPGVVWTDIQIKIIRILTQGLVDLELLSGSVDTLIEIEAFKDFYMHNSGHWLGLDVHDKGAYLINKSPRKLEEGMVLTVEPGLYLAPRLAQIDTRWHGIGVRIEDDVLVTANGASVLSEKLPKTVDDLKAVIWHD
jgi:Xaa-Pro aminopeptidase